MTTHYTRSPGLAITGAAILRMLDQLGERLARHSQAARDPCLAGTLDRIRDEAGGLVDLYQQVTRPGQCALCGSEDVALVAALSADPGLEVCAACGLDPDVATFPLSALADDREVWVVTRGDVVWLAGRELTDCEAARVAAAICDATAAAVACAVAVVCGQVPLA
jgi:hypothetical protein